MGCGSSKSGVVKLLHGDGATASDQNTSANQEMVEGQSTELNPETKSVIHQHFAEGSITQPIDIQLCDTAEPINSSPKQPRMFDNLQDSFQTLGSESKDISAVNLPAVTKGPVVGVVPMPSAGFTSALDRRSLLHDSPEDRILKSLIRMVCGATHSSAFCECVVKKLPLHRTTCLTPTFSGALIGMLSQTDALDYLDLSGNNAGPVAVRALLQILLHCDIVQELDLSDNMADSNCIKLLTDVLTQSKCLQSVNLSGNQLGKESLSRCLLESLQRNGTLVELKISSCGATNLHGLFEGLQSAVCAGKSSLEYLDISNNHSKDGEQLGFDISLILENQNCKLRYLNLENTGLNPAGWESVIRGMNDNESLRQLIAGGSGNQIRNVLQIVDIVFSNRFLSVLNLKGLSLAEEIFSTNLKISKNENCSDMLLTDLNLANCNLTDAFVMELAEAYHGKLSNLFALNLSNNPDLFCGGIAAFETLVTNNGSCHLKSLCLSGLKLENVEHIFANLFSELLCLSVSKSRISVAELIKLSEFPQILEELVLDGLKISQSDVLSSLLESHTHHRLTSLSLHGCGLTDSDLETLVDVIDKKVPSLGALVKLDISLNRITDGLKHLASAFSTASHPIENLNVSNNVIVDNGACELAEFILSGTCTPKFNTLNISHNLLTKKGLLHLMNTVASAPNSGGLVSLDVSHQKHGLTEDDLEDVVEALAAALNLDPELATVAAEQSLPLISPLFYVNISHLGGAVGPRTRQLDSVAIKTDFTKLCNTSPTLSDYLLIANGLKLSKASSSLAADSPLFSSEEWVQIIGQDAPAWVKVASERKKGVYINHLPGSATLQRLQAILEMEADCSVCETVFVKDPALQKPSGAAWVLFDDEQSVQQALDWYVRGEAQIFGTPFSISTIPASVSGLGEGAKASAQKEVQERSEERRKEAENDRAMMEASQRLAEERAAYREAHPAYQNGRIW